MTDAIGECMMFSVHYRKTNNTSQVVNKQLAFYLVIVQRDTR